MQQLKQKIQPSHSRGSLVQSTDLPFIQQGENLLISADLLHKRLKVSTKFSMWFQRRAEKYGFENGIDYFPNLGSKKGGRGGHNAIDYLLTIDTAKELAMLEENEIGRSMRRYFIQKEKEARGISQLPKESGLFKGMKVQPINGRTMVHYKDLLARIGYSTRSGQARKDRYPMHFVKIGGQLYITQEFALHLFHSKRVVENRKAMQAMQPVIPYDFGTPLQIKGGMA